MKTDQKKPLYFTLYLIGIVLVIIGSFMPWGSVASMFGNLSVSGMQGDGKIALGLGALILVIVLSTYKKKNEDQGALFNYLLGIILLFFISFDWSTISGSSNEFAVSSVGMGIFSVFFGAILIILGSFSFVGELNTHNFNKLSDLTKEQKFKIGFMVIIALASSIVGFIIGGNHQSEVSSSADSNDLFSYEDNSSVTPKEKPAIEVLSKYYSKDGSYDYVMGEVKNISDFDAFDTSLTVALLLGGKVVASEEVLELPVMIQAGGTVPYRVMIDNPPESYDEIKVEVEAEPESYTDYEYLEVIDHNERTGDYGSLSVSGEIKNKSGKDLESIRVYVWLLGSKENVVGLEMTYIDGDMDDGSKKSFEVDYYMDAPSYSNIKVLAYGSVK